MTRPLRLEFPNALYHLTSRGDRREPIYEDDADRVAWLEVFDQVCSRFQWRCHAWCEEPGSGLALQHFPA
jgi:putative transposase